jgi:hypothetical protein
VEKDFWTKPNGHRISLYYTLIIIAAIGFLIVPSDLFRGELNWLWIVVILVGAVLFTFLPRFFRKVGIVRCYLTEDQETGAKGFHIGNNSINLDNVTRFVKVSRPGFFGSELQIFEDGIMPRAIVVLEELVDPDGLISSLTEMAPKAKLVDSYTNLHFLDWGLGISLAALVVIIVSKAVPF